MVIGRASTWPFFFAFSVSALLLVSTTKKEEIFGGRELKLSTKENVFYLSRLLMKQVRSMKQTIGFLCSTSKWLDTLAQVTCAYMSPFRRQMSAYLYYLRVTVKWKTMSTQLSHAGAHHSRLRLLKPPECSRLKCSPTRAATRVCIKKIMMHDPWKQHTLCILQVNMNQHMGVTSKYVFLMT